MRTIYIDADFRCHTEQSGSLQPVETDFFDGKCDAYIRGYRFVPRGSTWVNSQGIRFLGQMAAPWVSHDLLAGAQGEYARGMAMLEQAYREGVNSL